MLSIQNMNNHASFLIEFQDGDEMKRVYVDPVFSTHDKKPISQIPYHTKPADLILLTHDHSDHYDPEAVRFLSDPHTVILCPETCKSILSAFKAHGVPVGYRDKLAGIPIETIAAYNPSKRFHPKINQWVGYLITCGSHRLYFCGDTDFIPEMTSLKGRVDIAFLHIGGNYTMDFAEGIKAIETIQPKFAVPIHTFAKDPQDFKTSYLKHTHGTTRVEIQILGNSPWNLE